MKNNMRKDGLGRTLQGGHNTIWSWGEFVWKRLTIHDMRSV